VEELKEAATGGAAEKSGGSDAGFEQERIATHLEDCAAQLQAAPVEAAAELAKRLDEVATEVRAAKPNLEELEASLSALEEKLFAHLIAQIPEPELLILRKQAASELAPYRSRMQAMQIRQVEQQFLHKRLLEKFSLPRLSLFYMSQS
jgi:predicted nuclease with TOPRIM domain